MITLHDVVAHAKQAVLRTVWRADVDACSTQVQRSDVALAERRHQTARVGSHDFESTLHASLGTVKDRLILLHLHEGFRRAPVATNTHARCLGVERGVVASNGCSEEVVRVVLQVLLLLLTLLHLDLAALHLCVLNESTQHGDVQMIHHREQRGERDAANAVLVRDVYQHVV